MKYLKAFGILVLFSSCNYVNNSLVGHSYILKPINSALQFRLMMGLNTIVHEYQSNSTVKVTTWQGKEPLKSEELSYSVSINEYKIDNEVYDLSFKHDTVVLSIQGEEYIQMIPVGNASKESSSDESH
ncbi:MAG: hypothetical protein JWQ09_3179 [Segetibacter sp.]|nr:hypothetical protein [Segetibacter sp.]